MKTCRNAGHGRVEGAAGGNQIPPEAPAAGMEMHVNLAGLTDGEVRIALAQMAQAIILKA